MRILVAMGRVQLQVIRVGMKKIKKLLSKAPVLSHDDAIIDLLRKDSDYAAQYLKRVMAEDDEYAKAKALMLIEKAGR